MNKHGRLIVAACIVIALVVATVVHAGLPTPAPTPDVTTTLTSTGSAATTTMPTTTAASTASGVFCTSQVIAVSETHTRPHPDVAAPKDGVGLERGQTVACLQRLGCWFEITVPNPGIYDAPRRHWIPVSETRSQHALPGGQCHHQRRHG